MFDRVLNPSRPSPGRGFSPHPGLGREGLRTLSNKAFQAFIKPIAAPERSVKTKI